MLVIFVLVIVGTSVSFGAIPFDTCGANEKYDRCGTYCPATCQVPFIEQCEEVCIAGCFCEEGYIRENLAGKCIPVDDCENACRDNEEYKECGLTCPPTCQAPVPSCANNCCGKGCFCKEGYILEDVSQECVAADQCPV
ncbi:hypothetical protein MTP99_011433 [Tenebrio molitor]|nr:hypothetical protein MTP99_011433 [Tenebrio molitor]